MFYQIIIQVYGWLQIVNGNNEMNTVKTRTTNNKKNGGSNKMRRHTVSINMYH